MSETVSVTVTERFVRLGVQHELGETLQLTVEDVTELVEASLVEPTKPPEGPKKAAGKKG